MMSTIQKIILFGLLFAATVKQSNGMDINGCLSRPFLLGLKEAEGISVSCNSGSMTFEPCPQESRPGENLSWKDNPAGKYLSDLRSMRQQTLLQRRYHIAKSLYDVTSVEKKYPDDQIYLNLSGEGDLSSLSSPDLSHPLCDAIQESSITHIDISWNYLDQKQILTFRQKLPNIKIIDDKYSSYAT